jgi:transposase
MSEFAVAPTQAPRPVRGRAATRAVWAQRLQRFADSGLRPAQFCANEGVSLPSFYAWKRRLRQEAGPAAEPLFGEGDGPRLLPVRLPPAAAVELVLPGGAVLRLLPGCDLALVKALALALGDTPC